MGEACDHIKSSSLCTTLIPKCVVKRSPLPLCHNSFLAREGNRLLLILHPLFYPYLQRMRVFRKTMEALIYPASGQYTYKARWPLISLPGLGLHIRTMCTVPIHVATRFLPTQRKCALGVHHTLIRMHQRVWLVACCCCSLRCFHLISDAALHSYHS